MAAKSKSEIEVVKREKISNENVIRDAANFFPNRVRCYTVDGVINIDFGFNVDSEKVKIQAGVALGRSMVENMIKQLNSLLEKQV